MRTVHELTQEELDELRNRLYFQLLDEGSLDEVMAAEIETEEEMPLDFVKEYYEGTYFVVEDFWCNLKDEEE